MSVVSAYRSLLRAQRTVFAGDIEMIKNALEITRSEFRKRSDVTDKDEIKQLIQQADEARTFLSSHVAQGVLQNDGIYKLKVNQNHLSENNEIRIKTIADAEKEALKQAQKNS
eukprot:c21918_g3_i1.p1 GENE.c21918_g3_i1~~c21918_g3_i1.p1  ORF type:complete len:113 (-),score=39.21 c21918_g3_i1:21-359(-)